MSTLRRSFPNLEIVCFVHGKNLNKNGKSSIQRNTSFGEDNGPLEEWDVLFD
jgi:hypothetical protein